MQMQINLHGGNGKGDEEQVASSLAIRERERERVGHLSVLPPCQPIGGIPPQCAPSLVEDRQTGFHVSPQDSGRTQGGEERFHAPASSSQSATPSDVHNKPDQEKERSAPLLSVVSNPAEKVSGIRQGSQQDLEERERNRHPEPAEPDVRGKAPPKPGAFWNARKTCREKRERVASERTGGWMSSPFRRDLLDATPLEGCLGVGHALVAARGRERGRLVCGVWSRQGECEDD
uniref:Uncharacterized protein n=1 Tax=Chromera velia CCMP2878 TaxID=1169474 RepID=A0A0G4FNM4_9ALVE|eukprot:Cvel_17895.t1-p1 / transcript=Cvel_17895.t1 / gene=Cvel_17895 / organism=Chromera_velia_CCMP2878 / gene_product=hypothetical protein / transcript_product=hypothetical protein / location=Cvel_scaffold1452:28958-31465(+) / protein_length=231 / sequence_SO=supercontig / SO=protein_coding / is_pseudo=false